MNTIERPDLSTHEASGTVLVIRMTRQEAAAALDALAQANDSDRTPAEYKGPNTWLAHRILGEFNRTAGRRA